MKDWTGNYQSVVGCLGTRNGSTKDREENDYYATDPIAAEWLMKLENLDKNIWECACGEGHLAKVFMRGGVQRQEYRPYRQRLWKRRYRLLKANGSI